MSAAKTPEDLAAAGDDELLDLLATEEDRLPRAAIDEVIRRGEAMIPALEAMCRDREMWLDGEGPTFWRQIHAVHALGAIGGERAIEGLVAALESAAEAENDWLDAALPAIFGRIGEPAIERLEELAADPDADPPAAERAIESLAGIAAAREDLRDRVLDRIRALAEDRRLDADRSYFAGSALLDFARPKDRRLLETFGREMDAEAAEDPRFLNWFGLDDVREAYARGPDLPPADDWLRFYDPAQIAARQERWRYEKERDRWRDGIAAKAPWVEAALKAALEKYEGTLGDLAPEGRARALDAARDLARRAREERDDAPWTWLGLDLEDWLDRRARAAGPGAAAYAAADAAAHAVRYLRFWRAEDRVTAGEMTSVEETVAEWARDFDPRRRTVVPPPANPSLPGAAKVGRNALCPCGSGAKYKRCCGKE